MANTLYNIARQKFLRGEINWDSATIKCALVDSGYTPDYAVHENLTSVGGPTFVAPVGGTQTGSPLTGKSSIAGAADANDLTFSSVTGDQGKALILYLDDGSGVLANFTLIAYIDSATGLPITPNGGDIIVVWDGGVNKIFRL